MPDDIGEGEGQDPGPIDTGPVDNVEVYDPGPIEIDVVMKNAVPIPLDPMAGRDLHLGDAGGQEDGSGRE